VNLSLAWAKAFVRVMSQGNNRIVPLIVSVKNLSNDHVEEDARIRKELDQALAKEDKYSTETVANTIFPSSLWNHRRNRKVLYERFTTILPRIMKHSGNRRGTYFQRLIAFPSTGGDVNQLEHIITTWRRGNHRNSALQGSLFDPKSDHKNSRMLGFPCMHQISFSPLGSNGKDGLVVTTFYATQYIFDRAYGNYLGLCRLGQFMAHEMNLNLVQVTCVAGIGELGNVTKRSLRGLENATNSILEEYKIEEVKRNESQSQTVCF
jgi:thymidylate synthase